MRFRLEGLVPALLTPFGKNGEVLYDRACELALRLAGQGVAGVFPCGTTGEGALMTLPERKKLLEELVAAAGKKIKILVQVGTFDTASTVELARHAAQTGAAAASVVAPGFYKYDEAALTAHYKKIANAVKGFPIFLYNIPGAAGNPLTPDFIIRMQNDVDNIVGLKDSSGRIMDIARIVDGTPKSFNVFNGVDEYTFQAWMTGVNGSVTSTANVAPELFLNVIKNVQKGNYKKARAAQTKLDEACALFQYGKMVAYYKEGLRLRGFDAGYVRGPQRELTARERRDFAKGFEAAGLA